MAEYGRASDTASRPTLCFFYSPTSGPSRRMEALLAQVLQRRQNHRTFALQRVNCDERPELAEKFAVNQLPTLIVIERNRVSRRREGICVCRELEQFLEPWLKAPETARGRSRLPDKGKESPSSRDAGEISRPSRKQGLAQTSVQPEEARVPTRASTGRETAYARVGLELSADLPFERWKSIGRQIGGVANASIWWLADWAVYGQGIYGEKYKDAIAVTGFEYQTLRNYAWVAGRYDVSRRRDNLSFGHHAEVASLTDAEQEDWLDRAQESGWSRNELRARLRDAKHAQLAADVLHVRLNVAAGRARRWRIAAEADGLDLSDWLVAVADDAAQRSSRRSRRRGPSASKVRTGTPRS